MSWGRRGDCPHPQLTHYRPAESIVRRAALSLVREARAAEAAPPLADAASLFPDPLRGLLARFAGLIQPHLVRLDPAFLRRLKSARQCVYGAPELKSLSLLTPGAAVRLIRAGKTVDDFFEQVAYNGRRLAKLNVPPTEAIAAVAEYDRVLDDLLANRHPRERPAFDALRKHLHLCTVLAVNNAFYQVREAETQAFYGLLRAEMDAEGLDDLLRRFLVILTRTFRAQAGRLIPISEPFAIPRTRLKRLSRACYIKAGTPAEALILDTAMRGHHQSYWSIPFFSERRLAGLVQFGFATPYRWLPRELELLDAFAERCLRAAERTLLHQNLAAREQEVRALGTQLLQAEEHERRRISREVHDEAGQSMLFLRLHLEMLEKAAPPYLQPKLGEARAVAEAIITDVRRIVADLNPSMLEQLGLPAAIRKLSARFRAVRPVQLKVHVHAKRLAHPTEAAVYRMVQECYQNIARHAQASHVNLSLRSTDQLVELIVEDDGVGFDAASAMAQPDSFGLKGMRERVGLLGGQFEIRSAPGKGARISVRLPLDSPRTGPASGRTVVHGENSHSADR